MRKYIAPSRIESLESRIAPASLVTVTFTKGALTLTGDAGAHDFTVTSLDATTTELHAATGTLFHMDGVADSDTLLLTSAVKSLTATLGDAADHVGLTGLNVGGDVTITGGNGANTVDINTVSISGGLKITGGTDGDVITTAAGSLIVKKSLTLDLGNGANSLVNNASLVVGKDVTYTGGTGTDGFGIVLGSMSIAGNLSLTTGAGDATVGLGAPNAPIFFGVGKKFTIDSTGSLAGDDVQVVVGGYATKVGGDIQVTDGAGDLSFGTQSVAAAGFRGNISIVSGPGEVEVQLALYQFSAKSITVDASASTKSSVLMGGFGTSFSSNVHYTGGTGDDSFAITTYGASGGSIGTSLVADLGDGKNEVNVVSSAGFFKTAKVTTGAGDDTIMVGALGAKMTSLDVQTGGGTDTVQIALLSSIVSGKISVANAATAVKSTVSLGFLSSVIGSVDVNLAGGDGNKVQFGSAFATSYTNGLMVKKTLHVATGAGADTVDFSGVSNIKVAGGIALELGDGANVVTGPFANLVTKGVSITGGSGADSVALSGSGNLGAVVLTLGAGANTAAITGGAAPLALGSLVYGSASAAADADGLSLARLIVAGKVDAKFGAGVSTFLVDDSIVGGTFNAETDAGADVVKIDTTDSYTGTVLAKAVTLKLGDDSDTLVLGGNGTSELVTTKAAFTADGGAGTNTLTNDMANVFAKTPVTTGF